MSNFVTHPADPTTPGFYVRTDKTDKTFGEYFYFSGPYKSVRGAKYHNTFHINSCARLGIDSGKHQLFEVEA